MMRSGGPTPGGELTRGDVVRVEIEKLVAGGDGLARHNGLPVFVPRSAPGDTATIRITQRKASYARGEIVELESQGAGRREPPCRHFGECGGCDLQHLEDSLQVELKAAATLETLERLARIELPEAKIVAGAAWGYRGRTQLHASSTPATVGYRRRGGHEIVALRECPVLVPELETAVRRLASVLPEEPPSRIDLTVGGDGTLTGAPAIESLPHGEVEVSVGDWTYALDARCFFQGHRTLLEPLVEAVVGEEAGELAVDLYAGVGLFTLPLSSRYGRVIAVEGDRLAARYGRINARRNGAANAQIEHRAVESWIVDLPEDCDRVVVDPPRAGLLPPVVEALLRRVPERLTYVSCHPAALARDLRRLDARYEVRQLTLLDLFPQTGHMEVVAQLAVSDPDSRP